VALVPLLVAIAGRPRAELFTGPHPALLGLVTGMVGFFGTLYWTAEVMAVFGGVNALLSWLLALLLVAYLALYPAAFAWITARLLHHVGPSALLVAPAIWVATEWVRGALFSGFPWVLLGYSQTQNLPVLQTASLVGIYGVSAVLVAVNAALAWVIVAGWRAGWRPATIVLVGVACLTGWGWLRMSAEERTSTGDPVRVGIVQGNVPQDQKWDTAHRDEILDRYLRLTREAAAQGATLVVWPESSTPFLFGRDHARSGAVRAMVHELGIHLVLGSDDVHPSGAPYYNAALMIAPSGRTVGTYHKMQLVPFGEYIPLRSLLFFAQPLVESVADFAPGESMRLLPVDGRRLSVAVCYEVVFPWHGRLAAGAGSELLTTITNDAWYGATSAPHQHFEQARVRAVETGRYLVRAANTGISGVIDPHGRVVQRSGLFETAVLVTDVRWRAAPTVYLRIGESFAYACLAMTLAALVVTWARRPAGA
jgi:apolipoprotein N-acyltransferase